MERKKVNIEELLALAKEVEDKELRCGFILAEALILSSDNEKEGVEKKLAEFIRRYALLIAEIVQLADCKIIGGNEETQKGFAIIVKNLFKFLSSQQKKFAIFKINEHLVVDLISLVVTARNSYDPGENEEYFNNMIAGLSCMLIRSRQEDSLDL